MDQKRIGRFIAECRKNNNLTQMQLAEKMNVTDRAVSKWETGRAMPDSSIMLDLCKVLNITVNELLSGEKINMENYTDKKEKKLVEMVREKERGDRRLLRLEIFICVLSCLILLIPIVIVKFIPFEMEWINVIIVVAGFLIALIGFVVSLRIEQIAGYYECKECGHRYVPSFWAVNIAPHMGRTKKMRCPNCGKKTWQKKVISKE